MAKFIVSFITSFLQFTAILFLVGGGLVGFAYSSDKPELMIKANESGDYMMKELFQKHIPFTNGLHNTYEIPDIMLGSAGVGYFFLRLYDAKQFESILLVSP